MRRPAAAAKDATKKGLRKRYRDTVISGCAGSVLPGIADRVLNLRRSGWGGSVASRGVASWRTGTISSSVVVNRRGLGPRPGRPLPATSWISRPPQPGRLPGDRLRPQAVPLADDRMGRAPGRRDRRRRRPGADRRGPHFRGALSCRAGWLAWRRLPAAGGRAARGLSARRPPPGRCRSGRRAAPEPGGWPRLGGRSAPSRRPHPHPARLPQPPPRPPHSSHLERAVQPLRRTAR